MYKILEREREIASACCVFVFENFRWKIHTLILAVNSSNKISHFLQREVVSVAFQILFYFREEKRGEVRNKQTNKQTNPEDKNKKMKQRAMYN
jgi:hypothetical protein